MTLFIPIVIQRLFFIFMGTKKDALVCRTPPCVFRYGNALLGEKIALSLPSGLAFHGPLVLVQLPST